MAKSISSKKVTLDTLATMVANGFALTATKEDLNNYVTKEELRLEIKNLKEDIDIMLSKYVGAFRKDFDDLARRVKDVERKVFH